MSWACRARPVDLSNSLKVGSKAESVGRIAGHVPISTISLLRVLCRPRIGLFPRPMANSTRRRCPGEIVIVGFRVISLKLRRRRAVSSWSDLNLALAGCGKCCSAQPPQSPKWRHSGSIRPGAVSRVCSMMAVRPSPRFGPTKTRTRSPGAV